MDRMLPKDLAGYQNIITGRVIDGDLIIENSGMRTWTWASVAIGRQVEDLHDVSVYRKMACPKAGDHDKGWKKIREDNPLEVKKAKTYDEGKPPLANLPWAGVKEVAMVQAYGHSKYNDFNNYRKGMEISRNLSCAVRHISDFMEGIDLDKESGRNHLAHACCRLLFVLQNLHDGTAIDDRYKNEK